MAPPSKLKVATGVLSRLVKEEASYHKELVQQEARIKKIQADTEDENAEYQLKQEVIPPLPTYPFKTKRSQRQALEETKNVFPSIRAKIAQALQNLEDQVVSFRSNEGSGEGSWLTCG
jgi:tubulin-specific chaperone A